jgi:hypothetical protein
MSVSRHPVALGLERQVGGATRLLATVMGLPLVDGILPALIIAGALSSPIDVLEAGLLVFGGSATMAVILAEMEGTPREQATAVLVLGAILLPIAAVEAALAETLASVLSFEIFQRFAGLVILTIAAKTASAKVGEYLPSPGMVVLFGLIASFEPSGAELALALDGNTLSNVVNAVAAVGVGLAFALAVALAAPRLRGAVDIDLFRFGSAVALGMLALSVMQVPGVPSDAPIALGVLAVTAVFAYDPASAESDAAGPGSEAGIGPEPAASGATSTDPDPDPDPDPEGAADSTADAGVDPEADAEPDDTGLGYLDDQESRAPWL